MLYETKDKSGKLLKVGKANADDVMKDGTIRRTHTSARQAEKQGYQGAKSEVVKDLGKLRQERPKMQKQQEQEPIELTVKVYH